jgi:hypothetical protein
MPVGPLAVGQTTQAGFVEDAKGALFTRYLVFQPRRKGEDAEVASRLRAIEEVVDERGGDGGRGAQHSRAERTASDLIAAGSGRARNPDAGRRARCFQFSGRIATWNSLPRIERRVGGLLLELL